MTTAFTQHFFIENRHCGSSGRGYVPVHGNIRPPSSQAFFCPICAEIWARFPVEGGAIFEVSTVVCRKHKGRWVSEVAGSTIEPATGEPPMEFPPAVLEWEFQRHLDYAAQQQGIAT